jgi:hypothetical protein
MRKQKSRCRLVMLRAQNDSHMLCVASRVGASSASAAAASVRAKPYADTYMMNPSNFPPLHYYVF